MKGRRTARQTAVISCILAVSLTTESNAQQPAPSCQAVYAAATGGDTTKVRETSACFLTLASALIAPYFEKGTLKAMAGQSNKLESALVNATPPRELQSSASGNPASTSAAGAGDAVSTVQPLAIAGGTVSAVGSGGGTNTISAFTINPAVFFDTPNKMQAASLNRVLDLTVLAPVSSLNGANGANLPYLGVRIRVNALGSAAGNGLKAAATAFAARVGDEYSAAAKLDTLLTRTPNLSKCVAAYGNATAFSVQSATAACGMAAVDISPDTSILASFREALRAARDSADARYAGLDLRFDTGDPTLGSVPNASGTSLFAGVAAGWRTITSDSSPSFGFKAHAAYQYVSLNDSLLAPSSRTSSSFEGAFAFAFMYPYEFQPLELAAGIEGAAGSLPVSGMSGAFRTDYVQFKVSLDVPISAANVISIAFASPVQGGQKATLSINANWQLLFAGTSPAKP